MGGKPLSAVSEVPLSYDGWLLLDYLAARFTYLPRARWAALAQEGRVTRDGAVLSAAYAVAAGERIACDLPEILPPSAVPPYAIVYADRWLLAIDKPAGLPVHGRRRTLRANLISHLRQDHDPPYPGARLVNRLDADTSGIVLVGLTRRTLAALQAQFAARTVEKSYLALVHGVVDPPAGRIELPLLALEEADARGRFVHVDPAGQPAQTSYRLLAQVSPAHALLQLTPHTGRTHQLRVHLAALGYPLVGDGSYGLPGEEEQRQALHCAATTFTHPHSGERMTVRAPWPADLAALQARLTRSASRPE